METKVQNNCVVVIPVYRVPTMMEQCSFKQCLQILNRYDITIVTNTSVDLSKFNDISQMCGKSFHIEYFDKKFFEGIKGYNALCLSKGFYQRFADRYVYMLIYQLDAWVFRDELQDWCDKGYDYVGSPFFVTPDEGIHYTTILKDVGNGGLSLRKLRYCIKVLNIPKFLPYLTPNQLLKDRIKKFKYYECSIWSKIISIMTFIPKIFGFKNTLWYFMNNINEDFILSTFASGSYYVKVNLPTALEAANFAWELNPSFIFQRKKDTLPFGCHAFEKYEYLSFWSKYIPNTIDLPNFMKVTKIFPYLSSFLDIYGDRLEKEEPMLSNVVLSGSEEIPQNGGLTQDDSPFMVSPVKGQNNSFVIYRNKELCNNMGLTENEQYSLIAHEFGHIIFKIRGLTGNSEDEEVFADETAAKVVGKDETLSALIKLQELIKEISAKSDVWNFIGPKPSIDLVADIEARIANIEKT